MKELDIRSRVLDAENGNLQRKSLAQLGLDQIFSGLFELHKLGHNFELTDQLTVVTTEWPKMYFHPNEAPQVVDSEDAAKKLGPEWVDAQDKLNPRPAAAPSIEDKTSTTFNSPKTSKKDS